MIGIGPEPLLNPLLIITRESLRSACTLRRDEEATLPRGVFRVLIGN